jgi:hypothetical protein
MTKPPLRRGLDPVRPCNDLSLSSPNGDGMSIREHFAVEILTSFIDAGGLTSARVPTMGREYVRVAVDMADLLMEELMSRLDPQVAPPVRGPNGMPVGNSDGLIDLRSDEEQDAIRQAYEATKKERQS